MSKHIENKRVNDSKKLTLFYFKDFFVKNFNIIIIIHTFALVITFEQF